MARLFSGAAKAALILAGVAPNVKCIELSLRWLAHVRRGSESVAASAEFFDELVHSRNSKTTVIAKLKGQIVWVLSLQHKLGEAMRIPDSAYRDAECCVAIVNPNTVRLRILGSDRKESHLAIRHFCAA